MLTSRLRRKSASKKKIQIKSCYRILGTEVTSYEETTLKLGKSQGKTNYTQQNEISLDSVSCVTMLNKIRSAK